MTFEKFVYYYLGDAILIGLMALIVYSWLPIFVRWLIGSFPVINTEKLAYQAFDILCDIMYPWYWPNLLRRWRNYQIGKRNRHMKKVTLYADGACSGNPGPGGWGAVLLFGEHEKELSGGEANTTNNRMELTAVIRGLEALKEPCLVELYSDSKYVIDGLDKGWAKGWRARGWVKADKKPALNPDLWGRLLELCETHAVKLHWVKGHADSHYNNRCDELAVGEWQKLDRKSVV